MAHHNLSHAQTALCEAITVLHTQWGTKPMLFAVAELDEAIDQVVRVMS